MTTKPKLDARGRLSAAESAVARWRKSIAQAEADKLRAADKGDHLRVVSIMDKLERLKDRLASAEGRLVHLREGLPKALKREQAVKRAIRGGVKLAERVVASAPVAAAGWAVDREKARLTDLRRRRRGLKTEGEEGQVLRSTKFVSDPYDGTQLRVTINAFESPLQHMRTRRKIDECQFLAGERFREVYEQACIGAVKAIDYGKPHVDGGRLPEVLNEAVAVAARSLADIRRVVGGVCFGYLETVIGERVALKEMAANYRKLSGERAEGFVAGQVVAGLDRLVEYWGMRTTGNARKAL